MRVRRDSLKHGALLAGLLSAACHAGPVAHSPDDHFRPPPDTLALVAPDGSPVPDGAWGRSVRRGHAILEDTGDSLPGNVGNGLRCTSCHLGDGRRPNAIPLIGVAARYPQYRSRSARMQTLEDRVNDCFQRSLNGRALAADDPAMRDIVTYLAWLSIGVPGGSHVPGEGLPLGPELHGDTVAGGEVFQRVCARCHGPDGGGTALAPAPWGPRSWSIGAGLARFRSAAAFIRNNMPFDRPGTLSDSDALNVAAYITSRPRPDFAGKENDWPLGDAPPDVAYPTRAGRKSP